MGSRCQTLLLRLSKNKWLSERFGQFYSLFQKLPLLPLPLLSHAMISSMYCRCSKAYFHFGVVWVSPWQMVELHFYHWGSGFQVYCMPLQVKADYSLHSAVKGIEKNALTSAQKYVYTSTHCPDIV